VLCAPLAFKPTQEPAPSAAVQSNDTAAKELALAKKEIANLKREITNLKVSNTKLRSGKKEREVVQKAKRDRKRKMGRTANPIVCESDPPLLQAVGEAFWEATVGLSVTGDGGRGQVKTGKHERQQVLMDFVKAAWDGEVWAKLKKECYAATRFPKLKIAHEMDANVNVNYTIVDTFRQMEANIKANKQGIICGSTSIKSIHRKISDKADELLGGHFPSKYGGTVWTCDAQKFCNEYFTAHCLDAGITGTKEKPLIFSVTGDGLVAGWASIFAAGVKKVDPRLASQQATGGTSNQSKHEYTLHTVAFLDEKSSLELVYPLMDELKRIQDEGKRACADSGRVLGVLCSAGFLLSPFVFTGTLANGKKICMECNFPADQKFQWAASKRGHGSNAGRFCHCCAGMWWNGSLMQSTLRSVYNLT
jgi:hypothetical protein